MLVDTVGCHQAVAQDASHLQRPAHQLRQRRDDFLGTPDAAFWIEPSPHPESRRTNRGCHLHDRNIGQERSEIVGDRSAPLVTGPRERYRGQQPGDGVAERDRLLEAPGVVGERDGVVGSHDLPGQGRFAEPDIANPDEFVAGWQVRTQRRADVGHREALDQQEIEELAVRLHPDRQGRPKNELRPSDRQVEPKQRQATSDQPGLPRRDLVPLCDCGSVRPPSERDPPTLASLRLRAAFPGRGGRPAVGLPILPGATGRRQLATASVVSGERRGASRTDITIRLGPGGC